MFSFLRRSSAQKLASVITDSAGNDDAEADEVENLLKVDASENERLRAKRTRSVTFEFEIEIKTEDEEDSSLSASVAGNDQDSGDSDWPATPRHQLVVEVPNLSPEEKQAYMSTTTHHEDADVSPLKMGRAKPRIQRARKARPSTTVSPDKPKAAAPTRARPPRNTATRRKVKVEEQEQEASRAKKRRKLNSGTSSSSDIEEIPPPTRATRSRKSTIQVPILNQDVPIVVAHVDEILVKAPARTTRRQAAAVIIEEEPVEDVAPRRSPRKRARGQ